MKIKFDNPVSIRRHPLCLPQEFWEKFAAIDAIIDKCAVDVMAEIEKLPEEERLLARLYVEAGYTFTGKFSECALMSMHQRVKAHRS